MGTIAIGSIITKSLMMYLVGLFLINLICRDCLARIWFVSAIDLYWFNGFKELPHIATSDLFLFLSRPFQKTIPKI